MVNFRINGTYRDVGWELRFPTINEYRRDSEIAPTEHKSLYLQSSPYIKQVE